MEVYLENSDQLSGGALGKEFSNFYGSEEVDWLLNNSVFIVVKVVFLVASILNRISFKFKNLMYFFTGLGIPNNIPLVFDITTLN